MKIQRITLVPVAVPRETGVRNAHVIVRLEAGDGLVGWGEMSDLSELPLYQFDLAELERMLNELLQGLDARNLAKIEDELMRYYPDEGHKYSRSGIIRQGVDLALHDLIGRAGNAPVYELLGGKLRERIKVCYPIFAMRTRPDVEANLERVQTRLNEGFDLIRVYVGTDLEMTSLFLRQFADRFSGKVAVKSLDFSNALDWRRAWAASERFADLVNFMLTESVALPGDFAGMVEYRRRSQWPVSEHVQHLQHGWQLLSHGCVDVLNVSPYVLGGLRASLRVVALAEAARASVLIGTTQELSLGTAAIAHLGAAARVLDYPCDSTGPRLYTRDVTAEPVRFDNGFLLVPARAGLGVEVDPMLLEELRSDAHWTHEVSWSGRHKALA